MTRKAGRPPQTIAHSAYLQSPPRIATILGSFLVLALPLVVLQLVQPPGWFALAAAYVTFLGGTHFLITLGVYLHGENLRYFASSASRTVVYFVTPAAILLGFFLLGYFGLDVNHEGASAAFLLWLLPFTLVVKGLDYLHVVRQSFGMLQLFKGQTGVAFPPWMRRSDNGFFLTMAGLQLWTFIGGMRTDRFVFVLDPVSAVLLAVAVLCVSGVMAGFAAAFRRARKGAVVWVPLTYFLFQAASASLAAWRTELYAASLAMHYVEYHVIIFPRLFTFELNPASRADRAAAWIRRHKLAFYLALGVLAIFVARNNLWPTVSARLGPRRELWLLFNLFNGIFVTHYFVEAFIWKFRDPYYRKSLAPLYFP